MYTIVIRVLTEVSQAFILQANASTPLNPVLNDLVPSTTLVVGTAMARVYTNPNLYVITFAEESVCPILTFHYSLEY